MEPFLATYGLPFEPFNTLLSTTRSLMAGSAPLALYLQQHGIDPGFRPSDIDLWVIDNCDLVDRNGVKRRIANATQFTLFLVQHGYNLTTKFEGADCNYESLHHVNTILSFQREDKEIQVILLSGVGDIKDYIHESFDLSPCITWWNARKKILETARHEDTLQRKMHLHPQSKTSDERVAARIEKYMNRGFCLMDLPCSFLSCRDPLTNLEGFKDETAFDLFAYDDLHIQSFLAESDYHMLMQVGNQFLAFHRTVLRDYLLTHHTSTQYGRLVVTPHKQMTVRTFAFMLQHSDYTVFRLVEYITYQEYAIYSVECYTVEDWFNKTPGVILKPTEDPIDFAIAYFRSGLVHHYTSS